MLNYSSYHSILQNLKDIGIQSGDAVFVHASMKSIGTTIGGPRTVVQALLDQVGDKGLVAMPGFSTDAYFPKDLTIMGCSDADISKIENSVPGFDRAKSWAREMGVIAETFRTWPGTLRSNHPTTSVCVNGLNAKDIVAKHSLAWAMGEGTPFGELYQRDNSKILLIWVGWNRCTALHTGESFAEIRREKMRRFKSGGFDGDWFETQDVADDLGRLFPAVGNAFEEAGNVIEGRLGKARCRWCWFRELVDFASDLISRANSVSGDRT